MAKRRKSKGRSKGRSKGKSRGRSKASYAKAAKKGWATRRSRGLSASLGLARHRSYGMTILPPMAANRSPHQKGHWIYIVTNAAAGTDSEHSTKAEAMKIAKARAKRERGQVAVEKVFLKPGHIRSHNVKGSGSIWRSDWRSE